MSFVAALDMAACIHISWQFGIKSQPKFCKLLGGHRDEHTSKQHFIRFTYGSIHDRIFFKIVPNKQNKFDFWTQPHTTLTNIIEIIQYFFFFFETIKLQQIRIKIKSTKSKEVHSK